MCFYIFFKKAFYGNNNIVIVYPYYIFSCSFCTAFFSFKESEVSRGMLIVLFLVCEPVKMNAAGRFSEYFMLHVSS